jgi:hypothetical protein
MGRRFQNCHHDLGVSSRGGGAAAEVSSALTHRAYLQLLKEGYVRVSASERDSLRAIFRANGELDHRVAERTWRLAELAHDAGEVEASVRLCMSGISLMHRYDSWAIFGDGSTARDLIPLRSSTRSRKCPALSARMCTADRPNR